MSVTGRQIAETTLEAYRCNGGYIWGQIQRTVRQKVDRPQGVGLQRADEMGGEKARVELPSRKQQYVEL